MFDDFYLISFVPILTGLFSALSCTLVGNILVLRKQAMLSDTISHVVLPGIVISFLIFGNLGSYFILLGAGIAGLTAVGTISALRTYTSMDNSAAMATTLSVFLFQLFWEWKKRILGCYSWVLGYPHSLASS